jgi:murein DD-endopeptidase MepM/ murein hydrolase activator NlpD
MPGRLSRRRLVGAAVATVVASRHPVAARAAMPAYSYPTALPERVLGDGFLVRHGYATENSWYLPGYWHAGEDWYTAAGDAAGAGVHAVGDGEVVFAGSDYPGRVVIVRHAPDLFSMYGHLDYALPVAEGSIVERGQLLGTILGRTDGRAPSHLHFEMRTFLTTPEVNGEAPRYGFACGFGCPPGPGYWPIDAPEHPSAMGWRNPTHVINRRAWPEGIPAGAEVVVSEAAPESAALWTEPGDAAGAGSLADVPLRAGDRYPILAVDAGAEDSVGTSAEAYRVWYRIALPDGAEGWVQAATPVAVDTGSDGRPSSVRFDLLPAMAVG